MPINAATLPLEQIARVKAKPLATAVFRETTPDDGPGDILYSERMHITLSKAKRWETGLCLPEGRTFTYPGMLPRV